MTDTTRANAQRTPEEIEAELAATRLLLTDTVDQLVHELTPATQIARLKANVADRAAEWKAEATRTLIDARDGDVPAMKKVAVVAGVAALAGVALIWRLTHR